MCKYVATVRLFRLFCFCVQMLKLDVCVCGCRFMCASGTLSCSVADVFFLMWDSEELAGKPGHMRQCFLERQRVCSIFTVLFTPNNH